MLRHALLPALALLVALAPAALAATEVQAHDDGQGGGAGYRFEPTRVEAEPGETVNVMNLGSDVHTFSHDVAPAERLFDEQGIQPGQTREIEAPDAPGEYAFKCAYHPEMTGVLVVEARAPPTGVTPTSGTPFDGGARPPTGDDGVTGDDETPGPAPMLLVGLGGAAALLRRRRA